MNYDCFCVVQVADMQRELEELQPQLVKASAENEKMMAVSIGITV